MGFKPVSARVQADILHPFSRGDAYMCTLLCPHFYAACRTYYNKWLKHHHFHFSSWKLNTIEVLTNSIPRSTFSKGYSYHEPGMKATINTASPSSFHYSHQCQTASVWQHSVCSSKSITGSRASGFDSRDVEKQPRRRGGAEGAIPTPDKLAQTTSPRRWCYSRTKTPVKDWKAKRGLNVFLGKDSTLSPTKSYRKWRQSTLRTKVN